MTKLRFEGEKKPAYAGHVRGGKSREICAKALGQEGTCMLWDSQKVKMAEGHEHKVRVAQKGMERGSVVQPRVWIFLKMQWEITDGVEA